MSDHIDSLAAQPGTLPVALQPPFKPTCGVAGKPAEAEGTTRVTIWTAASCIGNPGPGSHVALLKGPGKEKTVGGVEAQTTSSRMELTAAVEGVRALYPGRSAVLVSHSEYVVRGAMNDLPEWKARDWRKANMKPLPHDDLWRELDALLVERRVLFRLTKDQGRTSETERVGCLAEAEARRIAAEIGWSPASRYGF